MNMRTNLPKAPPKRDRAAGNPRRNPTRTDTQQTYFKMKTDLWRQLVKGHLVTVLHESRGLWREAYSLIADGDVKVELKTECTLYIRLNYDKYPELRPSVTKRERKSRVKFHLHNENHVQDNQRAGGGQFATDFPASTKPTRAAVFDGRHFKEFK